MRLILASASPRRRELLRAAGLKFEVRPSRVQEAPRRGETPEQFVRRAAREKALAVTARAKPGTLVLGADTVVVAGGKILGKPADAKQARRMLRLLSGRAHRVITGVCLVLAPGKIVALRHATTRVTFRRLNGPEISEYIRSREPFDKAGGYGIQGLASKFVTHLEGCYFNVVGLPVSLVSEMLKTTGGRRRQ